MGMMSDAAREGRTLFFVSHNMTAINQLCTRAVLISGGSLALDGKAADVVSAYLESGAVGGGQREWPDVATAPGNEKLRLRAIRVLAGGEPAGEVAIDQEVSIEVDFWNLEDESSHFIANVYLLDSAGTVVLSTANTPGANLLSEEWFDRPHQKGIFRTTCTFPANFLNDTRYYVSVYLVDLRGSATVAAEAQQAISFTVFDTGAMRVGGTYGAWHGVVRPRLAWRTQLVQPLPDGAGPRAAALHGRG